MQYPVTPDGRYFVVRSRLWRCSNPALPVAERERLVVELMAARRAVDAAGRAEDTAGLAAARAAVDVAKHQLGERGPTLMCTLLLAERVTARFASAQGEVRSSAGKGPSALGGALVLCPRIG